MKIKYATVVVESITLVGKIVQGSNFFCYLGASPKGRELDGDVAHRIKADWLK